MTTSIPLLILFRHRHQQLLIYYHIFQLLSTAFFIFFASYLEIKNPRRFLDPKRRGWDSNPRALSDKRFSRPPRYDHFDTSAYSVLISNSLTTCCILSCRQLPVNTFLYYLSKNISAICKSSGVVILIFLYDPSTSFTR